LTLHTTARAKPRTDNRLHIYCLVLPLFCQVRKAFIRSVAASRHYQRGNVNTDCSDSLIYLTRGDGTTRLSHSRVVRFFQNTWHQHCSPHQIKLLWANCVCPNVGILIISEIFNHTQYINVNIDEVNLRLLVLTIANMIAVCRAAVTLTVSGKNKQCGPACERMGSSSMAVLVIIVLP
jgi:hypothetical protein